MPTNKISKLIVQIMINTGNLRASFGEQIHSWHATEVEWLRLINQTRPTQLDGFFQFISDSVSYLSWGIPIILIFIAIAQKQNFWQVKAVYVLFSVALASLLSFILKHIIDRVRPFEAYDFLEKLSGGGSPSFPSGHTTAAFALSVGLILAYPRWYVILPVILWAILAGYSRMSLGVHYPSDVLAGAALGISAAIVCYKSCAIRPNKAA